jgi:hypothetical protein
VQAPVDHSVRQFAFHEEQRRAALNHNQVHLPAVDIAEVTQLQITAARILLVMDPLEKMGCNEILKPG